MAYTVEQFQVIASGTAPGGEVWYNSWCVLDPTTSGDVDEIQSAFAAFYADIAALAVSDQWTYNFLRCKNLGTEVVYDLAVNPALAGSDTTNDPLPNQLAVRVSLKALPNINGGPFLTGFTTAAVGDSGELANGTLLDIVQAVDDLSTNLTGNQFAIGIQRPSALTCVEAESARVGAKFDVIRKRANERLENYEIVSL